MSDTRPRSQRVPVDGPLVPGPNANRSSSTAVLGVYEEVGAVGQRLLDVLPPLLVVSDDTWDSTLIPVLAGEVTKQGPAQGVVLDRLLDLLLISVLRVWFDRPETEAPAWYRAHTHPVAGEALRLTEWRLALAADLLRQSDATLNTVARQVGYGSGSPSARRSSGCTASARRSIATPRRRMRRDGTCPSGTGSGRGCTNASLLPQPFDPLPSSRLPRLQQTQHRCHRNSPHVHEATGRPIACLAGGESAPTNGNRAIMFGRTTASCKVLRVRSLDHERISSISIRRVSECFSGGSASMAAWA